MRASGWIERLGTLAAVAAACGLGGCKALNERYIALEVWKYERCFGHLPPGFVPPGAAPAAAAPGRVCGQSAACQGGCPGVPAGCNDCGGMVEGGVPVAAPGVPTPAGVTANKPVVISDELVVP